MTGIVLCITVIGIPSESPTSSSSRSPLIPFGKDIVTKGHAVAGTGAIAF